jgi:hypothetical protein
MNLKKADLQEIRWNKNQEAEEVGKPIPVQFNPESLKLAYANQNASGDQRGGSAIQYVGSGTTKLTFDLWFDVTSAHHSPETTPPGDVRELTQKVLHFITPQKSGKKDKFVPPGVRFHWGTFLFEGVMESLNESLEYFSEDGVPLRAKVSVSLSKQEIKFEQGDQQANGGLGSFSSGRPRQAAKEGDSVPGAADKAGRGDEWPQIASANGIENPRDVAPGTLLDLGAGAGAGLAAGASFGVGAGAGASFGVGAGAAASAGFEIGAGVSAGVGSAGGGIGVSTRLAGVTRGVPGTSGGAGGGDAASVFGGVEGGVATRTSSRVHATFDARIRRR